MTIQEPSIIINGQPLQDAHAMTIRAALRNFEIDLKTNGLGNDEHGQRMAEAYLLRIKEIQLILQRRSL